MKCLLLIMLVFASDEKENALECDTEPGNQNGAEQSVVKIEEDEYVRVNKRSNYIGVTYHKIKAKWCAYRRSKIENKKLYNGSFKDEETAALASDTLARKLMENGEKGHTLNFPDDITEVYPEKTSDYIGVCYRTRDARWSAYRWGKNENKHVYNGSFKDEETAAHASDTLARKLITNGEQNHKLNFPDDDNKVYSEKKTSDYTSDYIGVSYQTRDAKWRAYRWSKNKSKVVHNGCYKNEETAALASDTLARNLIANGEQNHKLNFPDDNNKVYPEKKTSDYIGVSYKTRDAKWGACRWSKYDNKTVNNGNYKDEETAAHASDTLARKLIANGEKGHKLNFPDDDTEFESKKATVTGLLFANISEYQRKKRKRPENLSKFNLDSK